VESGVFRTIRTGVTFSGAVDTRETGGAPDGIDALRAALADRYTIEHLLGRGGMATVYRARDLRQPRAVAVKVLPLAADADGQQRFLREIEVVAGLQHPHIVPLFDSGQAGGYLYYVMPVVEGQTLRVRLQRDVQLPIAEAIRFTREIAEALDHAHARGVVHRDVKPENVYLSGGHALLADFGLARPDTPVDGAPLTGPGTTMGTPWYMSPEQGSGSDRLDGRSDQYSLACMLYEMLGGDPPFPGRSREMILARHRADKVPSLRVVRPKVPPALQEAIERALEKVPADRFATAGEFANALEHAARRRGWTRRRAFSAGALVVVSAAIGYVFIGDRGGLGPGAASAPDPRYIAVLYFRDQSANGELRHVANGLTEALIDELSRVEALRVISPSGIRPYRDAAVAPDSIARVFRVGSLVEGSVTPARNGVIVSVRMVDPTTGLQLESASLESPLGELFELQQQLAQEVGRLLRRRIGQAIVLRERRAATTSVAAWELVQRAEAFAEDADAFARAGSTSQAVELLHRADSLLSRAEPLDRRWPDPVIRRGWVSQARADLSPATDEGRWLHEGIGHAERALVLRPHDPAALELRGYLRFRVSRLKAEQRDRSGSQLVGDARRDLQAAVTTDPTRARAWNTLGLLHFMGGEFREARLTLQRGFEADAYLDDAPRNLQLLFFTSLELNAPDSARSWCQIGVARFFGDPRFAQCELIVLGWTGRTRSDVSQAWYAVDWIERHDSSGALSTTWGFRRAMVAAVLARSGLGDSARRVLAATRATAPSADAIQDLDLYEAYAYTELGDFDLAVGRLAQYLGSVAHDADWVARTRLFAPLRGDARFQALLRGPL
jgi:serine/threonine-protein kinase